MWSIPLSKYFPPRVYDLLTRRDEIISLAAKRFIENVGESPSGDF
ncbi:MAG: hypothetical protein OXC01_03085 [Immundisolibacterales bacterium]|nr:hypothetical protein [Immundisolibacterales bacterium]